MTVGHVVSKPLGSPVGLDDVRDPIHRVKTGRVCEGMPRSKRSGVRPIGRWRTFGSGHAEETCRSRIFHSDQSEKTCRWRIFHSDQGEKTCRSRIFHSGQSEKTCRSRIFHSDQSEKTCRSRIFHSDQSEKTCRSKIFHWGQSEKTCRSRNFHSDKSEKTCRSRIFHSDQSEKTCRLRIFPSGRGEETCRSRNFPTSRIPQQTFVLVLDRASTVRRSIPTFPTAASIADRSNTLKAVAFALESPSPRRSLLHSSRRIGDGRPRRLQAARFPGRIGRRPRPDSPSQNWSGVRGNAPVKTLGCAADRPMEDLWLGPR